MFAVIPAIAVLHNIARQCHDPNMGEDLGEDNDDDDDDNEDHVPGAQNHGRGILVRNRMIAHFAQIM